MTIATRPRQIAVMGPRTSAADVGKHPLTTQLVGCLNRQGKTFAIADKDLVRFRDSGLGLRPDGLLDWLRDLTVLIATLEGAMGSPAIAKQLREQLFAPLCSALDGHVHADGVRQKRQAGAKRAAANQLKSLEAHNRTAGLPRASKSSGATLRPRSK